MRRFKFGLDTLLEMRCRKEEQVKLLLAEKNRNIMDAQKEFFDIHAQLKELQNSEKLKREKVIDVMLLRYSVSYRFKLKENLLSAGQKIDDLKAQAEEIRKSLVAATKNRRAIEIIKERRFAEWKKEYKSQEQGFIDDISQQGFIRKLQSKTDNP